MPVSYSSFTISDDQPLLQQLASDSVAHADAIAVLESTGPGSVTLSSASVAFTNGDTVQKVTITDAAVSASSKVMGTILRPDTDDSADKGFVFIPNVVKRNAGSFELVVTCLDQGGLDPTENPPNETVTFCYLVS